jgi:NTP pyrophosphatase (non-canonical NTP hydrolase)
MDYKLLQREHKEWVDREYPNQQAWMPAVGCVEEAGELLHVMLKRQQYEVYGEDGRYKDVDWAAELKDAIGDCAIFVCSLANTEGWDFSLIMQSASCYMVFTNLQQAAVELVRKGADIVDNPSLNNARLYIRILHDVANLANVDFDDAILTTWTKVRERRRK